MASRDTSHMTPSWIRQRMREIDMEQFPALDRSYRCYSATFLDKDQAAKLESGDKIFLPPSALQLLLSQPSSGPMLFQLRNPAADRELVSHCGVLEFTAIEDTIYMPSWKMKSLEILEEGQVVQVKNVLLRKGTFVNLQPHLKDFLDITNPRAVLDKTLRSFTCFTVGDTIMLPYNGKEYYVNIIETKPGKAISIVDTDCEVDFAPPMDYVEPEKPASPASLPTNEVAVAASDQIEEPKFTPFRGAGRRLAGKPLPAPHDSSSSFVAAANNEKGNTQSSSTGSSSQKTSRQAQGKLVFGSNAAANRATTTAPMKIEKEASKEQAKPEKKEEPKFQPFTGKGYSLKG